MAEIEISGSRLSSSLTEPLLKHCYCCRTDKPRSEFHKNKTKKDGLTGKCRACNSAYYQRNAVHLKAKMAEWRKANPDRSKVLKQRYVEKHPDRVRESKRAWEASNLPMKAAKEARRRAAKLCATPSWADHLKIAEFYSAADFLGMITGEWYHVDHIVPLQSHLVCGFHADINLQVLCGAENQAKGNRWWPDMP